MLIEGVYQALKASSAVAAIAKSIRPIVAPVDLSDYPCVTYQVVSRTPTYSLNGDVGVSQSRIVFECSAIRYVDAAALIEAVYGLFSGFQGALPDGTRVYEAEIVNQQDDWNADAEIYSSHLHVIFTFQN
jgi:hypothetical protein